MKEFQSMDIDFISYQENIDTTTPTGELIFHVMAFFAQFESSLISRGKELVWLERKHRGNAFPDLHYPPISNWKYLSYKTGAINEQDFQTIRNSLRNRV